MEEGVGVISIVGVLYLAVGALEGDPGVLVASGVRLDDGGVRLDCCCVKEVAEQAWQSRDMVISSEKNVNFCFISNYSSGWKNSCAGWIAIPIPE